VCNAPDQGSGSSSLTAKRRLPSASRVALLFPILVRRPSEVAAELNL
jgi:hypothetical protein